MYVYRTYYKDLIELNEFTKKQRLAAALKRDKGLLVPAPVGAAAGTGTALPAPREGRGDDRGGRSDARGRGGAVEREGPGDCDGLHGTASGLRGRGPSGGAGGIEPSGALRRLSRRPLREGRRGGVTFDIVVRGGYVADGAGNPLVRTDVGVCGDRIAALGRLPDGRTTVDASGRVVAPGFIDAHNHVDHGILRCPEARNTIRDHRRSDGQLRGRQRHVRIEREQRGRQEVPGLLQLRR